MFTATYSPLESPAQLSPPFIFAASQSFPNLASNLTFPQFKGFKTIY